jgi:MYXO-CTERM domain-containing protein
MRTAGPAVLGALVATLIPSAAHAGIIAMSSVTLVTPPPSLMPDQYENSYELIGFAERIGFAPATSFSVDITLPGAYEQGASLTPGTIAAGTPLDVFYFQYDPMGDERTFIEGSMTFDKDIIGVIISDERMNSSDTRFGLPGTVYPHNVDVRGLETYGNSDSITISADRRTIYFDLRVTSSVDSFRVITSAVPGPGALGLLALGAIAPRRRRSA